MFRRCVVVAALGVMAACAGEDVEPTATTEAEIVGGQPAPHGNYEWMVTLWKRRFLAPNLRWCGGTLIAPRRILTAGHCADDADYAKIGPNENQEREVVSVEVHPSVDIAVLTIDASTGRTPIRLNSDMPYPAAIDLAVATAHDANATAAGWGDTSFGGPPSTDLLEVDLPIVTWSSCNAAYQDLGFTGIVDEAICAGAAAGGIDACQGDSGGPLWAGGLGGQLQVGVVSGGLGCGDPNSPGVYMNVAALRDWIAARAAGAEFLSPAALINATRVL